MATPITSHNKADAISSGLFLIGLGLLSYIQIWWPNILLVIGFSLMARQFLRGRTYDMALTFVIFGGLFVVFFWDVSWDVLMPVLFTVGGIYIIFREYFVSKERVGDDKVRTDAKDIEEAEHDK